MYTHVNLLGPYGSGTNLVNNILKTTLISKEEGTTRIWKHSMKRHMIENYTKEFSTTLFVVCYRPLYSWLKGLEVNKYGMGYDDKLDTPVKIAEYTYKNIVELYEHYYNNYKYLIERCPNVIFVEYFKVCDPAISYEYMQAKLKPTGVVLPDRETYNAILNTKAKNHGTSVSSSVEALDKKRRQEEAMPADFQSKVNPAITAFFEQD